MPGVDEDTPMTSVLGDPRPGFARHVFRGGNFLMLGMLNRYRSELGVKALPQEIDASLHRTVQQSADGNGHGVDRARRTLGRAPRTVDIAVQNLSLISSCQRPIPHVELGFI